MERKRKPDDYYDRRFAKESRPQDPRSRPGMSSISPMMDPHEYHWPRFSPPGGHRTDLVSELQREVKTRVRGANTVISDVMSMSI